MTNHNIEVRQPNSQQQIMPINLHRPSDGDCPEARSVVRTIRMKDGQSERQAAIAKIGKLDLQPGSRQLVLLPDLWKDTEPCIPRNSPWSIYA